MELNPSSTWSNIVKTKPPSKPLPSNRIEAEGALVGNCKSKKGISVAIVDANAIIEGCHTLTNLADKFVTVPQVYSEIRDSVSRGRLDFLPFTIDTMELTEESLTKVTKFARATGDLHTLSPVDLKLIALTYTLEAQLHGTKHLRDVPPPIRTVAASRLTESTLHGWGSLEDEQEGGRRHKRYPVKKREVKLEGKMVVEGVDASQGQHDDDDGDDWKPAVCRSTHRRFLKGKARREHHNALAEEEDSLKALPEGSEDTNVEVTDHDTDVENLVLEENMEQSSSLFRALSESSVACVTSDYAMQNVIIQMGLRVVAPGGMQIRKLHRWTFKCHACCALTPENETDFCPKCGNGGTLRKVAVTTDENGTIVTVRKPRITTQGTKFSIPMPKGGRDGTANNLVLREDQLPRKFLYPKTTKNKASKPGDEYFASDDVFMNHHSDKKEPLKPPVGKTMAIFRQKWNPNDKHYSHSLHL